MTEEPDRSGGIGADESGGGGVDLDEFFEVLADRRRRYALYHLRRVGGEIDLTALARTVLEWETGTDARELPEKRFQRVYLDFYHNHVPLLSDRGIVSYCEEEGFVRLEADLREATAYLELARVHDDVPPANTGPRERRTEPQ